MIDSGALRYQLRCLGANLLAGARLVLGLRTDQVAFRISFAQFVWLNLLLLAIATVDDAIAAGGGGRFNAYGLALTVFNTVLVVLVAWLLARAFRQPHLALALPVMLAAGEPLIDLAHLALTVGDALERIPDRANLAGWWLLLGWSIAMTVRAIAVALGPSRALRWPRAIVGALFITGVSFASLYVMPNQRLWQSAAQADTAAEADQSPSVVSEEALAAQPQLLNTALSGLARSRAGDTDLYFVGFAPYAAQDVFRKDILAAREVLNRRFDTAGRSLVLINNRRTLLEAPLATVTNLRAGLKRIGTLIDADKDIVFLYLSSHGSRAHELTVEFDPLDLQQLTPADLHDMLVESGIKWKVIVVSACYSGGFIAPLKDDHSLVMTAAQADRSSFGCSNEADFTYFGDAYFNRALRENDSFLTAFDQAKSAIARREKREGMSPPSNPQIAVGTAMMEKLRKFEEEIAARRRGSAG